MIWALWLSLCINPETPCGNVWNVFAQNWVYIWNVCQFSIITPRTSVVCTNNFNLFGFLSLSFHTFSHLTDFFCLNGCLFFLSFLIFHLLTLVSLSANPGTFFYYSNLLYNYICTTIQDTHSKQLQLLISTYFISSSIVTLLLLLGGLAVHSVYPEACCHTVLPGACIERIHWKATRNPLRALQASC